MKKPRKPHNWPTPQEVEEYAKTKDFVIDGQSFCDFYEARDYKVKRGNNWEPIKFWKLCVLTWKKVAQKNQPKHEVTMPTNLTASDLVGEFESSRGTGG